MVWRLSQSSNLEMINTYLSKLKLILYSELPFQLPKAPYCKLNETKYAGTGKGFISQSKQR